MAWEGRVSSTYGGSLSSLLWDLAYASGCAPGQTEAECTAAKQEGAKEVNAARKILNGQLSWMSNHPAARCFRDAYSADRAVASRYLHWLSDWGPRGGEYTPAGQNQIYSLQDADAKLSRFLNHLSGYFSDCK